MLKTVCLTRHTVFCSCLFHHFLQILHPGGICMKKQEEKRPITEEVMDPKPPVIQSGHMENHRHN